MSNTQNTPVKNIVFDIGNVLVKWEPYTVIKQIFPEFIAEQFYHQLRPVWLALNLGRLTEREAIKLYQTQLNISEARLLYFIQALRTSQTPIPGSLELLDKLYLLGFSLYSITDNIKETIEYHTTHSKFIDYFKDVIVSADVGVLKPDKRIYQHLLDKHKLNPQETVFIDDLMVNVQGALSVGMQAFQFIDVKSCIEQLINLGINLEY